VVSAGIGFAIATPLLRTKIVPRLSVANERWPVDPTLTGTALAKYELAGWLVAPLHVAAGDPTSVTPAAAFFVTVMM
jgi:hypothetical protein